MDNYYYAIQGLTLFRHQCRGGFVDCQPDPANNLTADGRTRVDGNPGLKFANGTTVSLAARGVAVDTSIATQTTGVSANNSQTNNSNTNSRSRNYSGADCADTTKRLSQFRWKSDGLSSWPDGVNGRYICVNNAYYEIEQNSVIGALFF